MKKHIKNNRDNIHGILLLDKPIGLSSNYALQKVKKLFNANKAGYIGTLDPHATGMLPICLGKATKFSKYLLYSDKRYYVIARLGQKTDTADITGKIINVRPVILTLSKIEEALNYIGSCKSQIPSIFSAIKYQGCPLYKYARKGITVSIQSRAIQIYSIHLHYWDSMRIELDIHCSKGTYIRTLIDDLGEYLGCGAHVITLRRLSVSHYSSPNMITLSKLEQIFHTINIENNILDVLLPIESIVMYMSSVYIPNHLVCKIQRSIIIPLSMIKNKNTGLVKLIIEENGKFLGVGEIISDRLIPHSLIKYDE